MYQDPAFSRSNPHVAIPSATATSMPPSIAPLRVGLLGLGTVGLGTYTVLRRNADLIAMRTGQAIEVVAVAVRNTARAQALLAPEVTLLSDPFALVDLPEVDVVVEVLGGTTVAKDLVLRAIANGKHVVTANKALLAEHGNALFAAAQAQGVVLAYEGAVAVSIPIIKALREGLSANRIEWLAGIINGTSNFILSAMRTQGVSFAQALADAQAQGFAEADPTLDVEGGDAAHKLALLASNAFGTPLQFAQVHTQGITQLTGEDIDYAARLGYQVKLLGIAKRNEQGLELRVQPCLLPQDHLLAQVHGSMNAVMVKSDAAGLTMYYGAGAGSEQTASAVIADLVDLCRSARLPAPLRVPYLGIQASALKPLPVCNTGHAQSRFYVRFNIGAHTYSPTELLAQCHAAGLPKVELHSFSDKGEQLAVVLLTQALSPNALDAALAALRQVGAVRGAVHTLRLETLQ
ncbi:homoserine dehydrogenase [Rhodoferax aquaticus]|uniref:Homoserine dehydrogenase n=1 Tax=Rhodoferax aquaticus TaxID=2527691 RepID=A0A515EJV5_9BURK|nr:homoserine dehydrogenase [Rhodoferax aquaticus]QDL52938.1 homoserine dehydrogenase [Rhodoferax aquaticus]